MPTRDALGRPLGALRISVTDRCNLRCGYCMPEDAYEFLPHRELLRFEELATIARAFATLGVEKLRLTGGEPLLRRDLPELVRMLAVIEPRLELALTTNGVLLEPLALPLRQAGLDRITVSLDTLDRSRFVAMTRRDSLRGVLRGLDAARAAGFAAIKLDSVVIRGQNDDELGDLLDFARREGAELRFIEYMDVGGATRWRPDAVVSADEILARLARTHGPARALGDRGASPAERYVLADGTLFGVIASTTRPFCRACDRGRLTADGQFFTCLYGVEKLDLRAAVRGGMDHEELVRVVVARWQQRADRGAELRAGLGDRAPLVPLSALRRDPHLEMHTRGG